MRFREHRGGLSESLETTVEIEATKVAIANRFNEALSGWPVPEATAEDVKVEPYGYDDRINWETHIVSIRGFGVFGFCDSPAD